MNPTIPKCKICGAPGAFQNVEGAMCQAHWDEREAQIAAVFKRTNMKTANLIGPALDWAVAKCEGHIDDFNSWLSDATLADVADGTYHPSTNWAQGGPIIEREKISAVVDHSGVWLAYNRHNYADEKRFIKVGQTALVAAMRCFVVSKLGDDVEIPEELCLP